MRKIYIALTLTLAVLTGCSKIDFLSSKPFTIEIPNVQSKAVWVDVVPETNDFGYYFDVISVKDYEYKYSSDANLCAARDAELRSIWEEYSDVWTFREFAMYSGSYILPFYELEPETEYFAYAYPYDEKDRPVDKVVKTKFFTKPYRESDIQFTVTLDGSMININPSNSDSYYWDWEDKETLEKEYYSPTVFYYCCLQMNEEYGFMDAVLSRGKDSEDITPYYDKLNPGDQFFLVASGYSDGPNSELHAYALTYAGEGLPGMVEELDTETLYENSTLFSRTSREYGLHPSGHEALHQGLWSARKASSSIHSRPL